MTYLVLAFGLLLPWLTGLGLVLAVPRGLGRSARGWPWAVISALPLGCSAHVLLASLLLLVTPGWLDPLQILLPELLLAGGVFGWGLGRFLKLRRHGASQPALGQSDAPLPAHHAQAGPTRSKLFLAAGLLLNAGFFASLFVLGWLLVLEIQKMPLGYFDAWHIWDFKARIIGLGQDQWRWFLTAPEAQMSHQEYPLGFSVFIGRMYLLNLDVSALFNQAVALGAGLLWPLLVWSCVLKNRGLYHAGFAGLVSLAFAFAIVQSAWQYADVPLACLFVLTVGWHYSYCRHDNTGKRPDRVALAVFGLLMGSLFWLKNEGMVIALAICLVTTINDVITRGMPLALKRLGVVLVPFGVLILMALHIKLAAPEVTDLIKEGTGDKQVGGIFEFERIKIVALFFWNVFINQIDRYAVILGAACVVILGLAPSRSNRWLPAWYAASVVMISAAYTLVLLATPYELSWHLGTAGNRLLIHLWPAAVLILSLSASPMDKLFVSTKKPT